MADDAELLKKLEQSLGGPNGVPLIIGCDEEPADIASAMECIDPDVEFRIAVREFQGADTYIITKRTPTTAELAELDRLMSGGDEEAEGAEEEEEPESGEGDGD